MVCDIRYSLVVSGEAARFRRGPPVADPERGPRRRRQWNSPYFPLSLRFCEHAAATRRVSRRDFLLQHVPVFDHFAVRYAKDIDRNHRLWPPACITAMHHDEITIRDGHAWFIREGRESRNHLRNG